MFGSKIIHSAIGDKVKFYYHFIKNLPTYYRTKIFQFLNYYKDLKYKLTHLSETNLQLGLEYLYANNLNDAIIRFKLIDKFFSPENPQANYWLGWAYFLKNNYEKASYHLQKSFDADKVQLGTFLKHYKDYQEIPELIWSQYRDLIAQYYANNFRSDHKIDLPYRLIHNTLDKITNLPDHYSILELGSNIGLLSYEIKKRFPDSFTLVAVENSAIMNKLVDLYYPNMNIHDQLLEISVQNFIKHNMNKFDVILSFCALSFTRDLKNYFNSNYLLLNNLGYFAFCLPIAKTTELLLQRKEFMFNSEQIKEILHLTSFTILSFEELSITSNNKYCVVVCRKIIHE